MNRVYTLEQADRAWKDHFWEVADVLDGSPYRLERRGGRAKTKSFRSSGMLWYNVRSSEHLFRLNLFAMSASGVREGLQVVKCDVRGRIIGVKVVETRADGSLCPSLRVPEASVNTLSDLADLPDAIERMIEKPRPGAFELPLRGLALDPQSLNVHVPDVVLITSETFFA